MKSLLFEQHIPSACDIRLTVETLQWNLNLSTLTSDSDCITVRLWDTEACINRVIYRGHTQTVWGLAAGSVKPNDLTFRA